MHETAVARRVWEVAESVASQHCGAKVARVRLCVGAFAHIDPSALQFAFEVLAPPESGASAALQIERERPRARCAHCGEQSESDGLLSERCSSCGTLALRWEGSIETEVVSVTLDLEESP